MILKVYSVYDSMIGAYAQPFFCQTKGAAIRMYSDQVNAPDNMLSSHPEDYTLFEIAEYDDSKGLFLPYETNVSCGVAIEFKK